MDDEQSSDTDHLTDVALLEMKSRLDDELQGLLIAESAVGQESEPGDIDELKQRVHDLQQQLLEESNKCSNNELFLKRVQLGKTLCDSIFLQDENIEDNVYMERSLEALELASEIKRTLKETLDMKEKLEGHQLTNSELRKENMEIMQRLQSNMDKAHTISSEIAQNKNYKRLKRELDVKCKSLEIKKNIIPLLITGMGEDWELSPELNKVMLECGEPLNL